MARTSKSQKEIDSILATAKAIKGGVEAVLITDQYVLMSKKNYQETLKRGSFIATHRPHAKSLAKQEKKGE